MRPARPLVLVVAALAGCYEPSQTQTTFPQPTPWYGPPGGSIDSTWTQQDPNYPGYPVGYPDGSYEPGYGQPEPSSDPADAGYVMGSVTDAEIDTTLDPYGEWIEVEDYGRVWRPYATVVGADFTPYETCGSWIYTDYGWTYQCDWDWGWLPFHYGRWAYLDDSWGWVPDYTWGPAWVEWRHGGGYLGWRPLGPSIRDHRDGSRGHATIRDHRRGTTDRHWRFSPVDRFGTSKIRDHIVAPPRALEVTSIVTRPPVRGNVRGNAATVMGGRLHGTHRAPELDRGSRPTQPGVSGSRWQGVRGDRPGVQPGTRGTYSPPSRGTYPPSRGTYSPPSRGTYPPSRGTYSPPSRGTYEPPSRGTYPPSRGTYEPPSRPTYTPPSRPTYTPPARSNYTPPARSNYTPPARSTSSPPSRPSYSPPSRSSGSSQSPSRSSGSSGSSRSHRR